MAPDIKYNTTKGNDLDNLKATDDATPLLLEYDNWSQTGSNPKDGRFRRYWPNGNLRYEWYYKDGKRADGISKGWWYNGNLKQTITWKNGKKVGLFTAWYENGQKKSEKIYKKGKLISEMKRLNDKDI
tara:strand:- start:1846 stop:2229 length:384 start_codon:yes stop_codon:yes gene_type:complete